MKLCVPCLRCKLHEYRPAKCVLGLPFKLVVVASMSSIHGTTIRGAIEQKPGRNVVSRIVQALKNIEDMSRLVEWREVFQVISFPCIGLLYYSINIG